MAAAIFRAPHTSLTILEAIIRSRAAGISAADKARFCNLDTASSILKAEMAPLSSVYAAFLVQFVHRVVGSCCQAAITGKLAPAEITSTVGVQQQEQLTRQLASLLATCIKYVRYAATPEWLQATQTPEIPWHVLGDTVVAAVAVAVHMHRQLVQQQLAEPAATDSPASTDRNTCSSSTSCWVALVARNTLVLACLLSIAHEQGGGHQRLR